MKLNSWINRKVLDLQAEINEFEMALSVGKEAMKQKQKVKKALGRLDVKNRDTHEELDFEINRNKVQLEQMKVKITSRKDAIVDYKLLSKLKPIRLKTGAVVSLKRLEEMQKKLKGFDVSVVQYKDGIQLNYYNDKTKTSGKFMLISLMASELEEVELPIYEEGEVSECSIS